MDTTVITEVATTVADMQYKFAITPENLAQTAPILLKGMIGIFIVMGIIILCVSLLNNLGSPEKQQKGAEKKAAKAAAKANNNTNQ